MNANHLEPVTPTMPRLFLNLGLDTLGFIVITFGLSSMCCMHFVFIVPFTLGRVLVNLFLIFTCARLASGFSGFIANVIVGVAFALAFKLFGLI
ncbi:hypothetical protein CMV05_23320 (plasmid) [Vibrio anguillarum]|nr:hypothetical protein CMV05_23320 [Vibrio anguillarum]